MTFNQALWASRHDWYVTKEKMAGGSYAVYVNEVLYKDGEVVSDCILRFESVRVLRDWAGY